MKMRLGWLKICALKDRLKTGEVDRFRRLTRVDEFCVVKIWTEKSPRPLRSGGSRSEYHHSRLHSDWVTKPHKVSYRRSWPLNGMKE